MKTVGRGIMFAAVLAALPMAAALAQTGGSPTNGSSTADHARLGGTTGPATAPTSNGMTASGNSNVPGATGRTVVPGNNSTVGGDSNGTALSKTGGTGAGAPGGSGR